MRRIQITNSGCDADTDFEMSVTDEQYEFVELLCAANNKEASGNCQPTLTITLLP